MSKPIPPITLLFRNTAMWKYFRDYIAPQLRARESIYIWHTACSTGEEVYSMATLLYEEDLSPKSQLYATDVAHERIDTAQNNVFSQNIWQESQQNYVQSGGKKTLEVFCHQTPSGFSFRENLRKMIAFRHHDFTNDSSPGEFQVIFCRNAICYYGLTKRRDIFTLLHQSLQKNGYLVLGSKENLIGSPFIDCYTQLNDMPIYQKISS
ncbi:CheR family methyltransferase [Candidatus Uabimicrobium amorphum]|uniref:Chemotaxis protein R n=1 Tax=Uabimicrobium amorphum TaxID=2596890 RepID=A0A5S9IP42_UABAM|nr:CheR family methyltransferase [Candidatus Uabimicrobium amorphum]BBM85488.1 chemotaxis protein R [Candidatus Uabimicrobium amorphum]